VPVDVVDVVHVTMVPACFAAKRNGTNSIESMELARQSHLVMKTIYHLIVIASISIEKDGRPTNNDMFKGVSIRYSFELYQVAMGNNNTYSHQ